MTNLYSRLYTYRQSAERRPLEDFLTEAFADLFHRLELDAKLSLLDLLLPAAAYAALASEIEGGDELRLQTQVKLEDTGKRPDMVLSAGRRQLVVIEAKIGAGLQQHTTEATGETEAETRDQLETYARWIAGENEAPGAWRGALVLLTAWTEAPAGFTDARQDGVVTAVATWKEVGLWLEENASSADAPTAASALARDLHAFIREKDLMTKYPSSRDLAAAMMFARSFTAIEAMFDDTLAVMAKHVPKLSAGRRLHSGFWSEGNVFWAWFHFARAIRRRPTLPYLAVGICFELPEMWAAAAAALPSDEPFLFVFCEDDNEREKAASILEGVPSGWSVIDDGWGVISHRPVSGFPADPDKRVQALQDWAKGEIDRLVPLVPGYEAAPVGPVATKVDKDED